MKKGVVLLLILVICETAFSQTVLSAEALLSSAFAKAKKENKNVFVIFTASWCSPCRFLKYFISDDYNRSYFEDNYVFVELHDNELGEKKMMNNSGARNILIRYNGDTTQVPYQLILNADSKKIADYRDVPVNAEDVPAFINFIKRTSRIKDFELKMISERIKQLSKNPESY